MSKNGQCFNRWRDQRRSHLSMSESYRIVYRANGHIPCRPVSSFHAPWSTYKALLTKGLPRARIQVLQVSWHPRSECTHTVSASWFLCARCDHHICKRCWQHEGSWSSSNGSEKRPRAKVDQYQRNLVEGMNELQEIWWMYTCPDYSQTQGFHDARTNPCNNDIWNDIHVYFYVYECVSGSRLRRSSDVHGHIHRDSPSSAGISLYIVSEGGRWRTVANRPPVHQLWRYWYARFSMSGTLYHSAVMEDVLRTEWYPTPSTSLTWRHNRPETCPSRWHSIRPKLVGCWWMSLDMTPSPAPNASHPA